MLCLSAVLKAQTDTVTAKINKIPVIHVDVLAKFPGGDFTKYIAANINYQKKSDRSLRGQVILSVKIDTNGRVSNVNILKSMSPEIDQEVAHVIRSSPRWQPAMLKGRPIGVYMVFNIDMSVISALAPVEKAKTIVKPPVVNKPVIEPVTNTKKPPVVEKKPKPLAGGKPSSAVLNKPTLKAIKKQAPPFDKKPVPVEKKAPLPPIIKKSTPTPVVKKSAPIKKPVPPAVKKMPPPIKKKAEPVVVKKPVPQVTKKTPAPVVKKNELKILPKPAFATVKTTMPLVAKKSKTPIAKQSIKPIDKKAAKEPVKHKPLIAVKTKKKPNDNINQTLGQSSEAQYPNGGLPGFFKYLSDNIHYPILSKINKIEGEVNLSFVIDKDGTVTDVKILSAPAEDLAQEAKRVILAAPKWKPAMQNGTYIKEAFTVPINFKFQDKQSQQ